MATTERSNEGFEFTLRLESALLSLSDLVNNASSVEEYYRLDAKSLAVEMSANTWFRITTDADIVSESQRWADMQEATESKYRTTTGGEREGYSLVLDYLRAVPSDVTA